MKTNVIMTRKMGQFDVMQRTQDGYFDANILLSQWNNLPTNTNRRLARFLESDKTVEFIKEIELQSPSAKMHGGNSQAVIQSKGRNTKNGRTHDQTWMHPYLFIDFAMWINPKFKYEVIKFVYDELIKNRHLAGDKYRCLSASLSSFTDTDYVKVAKGLNYIVFNNHYKDIRNNATDSQLDELHRLEEQLSFSIENGFITNFQQLITLMRKLWCDKWNKI